jgi:F0F1-type ATP synthase assembly protein I
MVNNTPDGRSPIAVAIHWASQVTTISIEMVLPLLLGVWVDRWLHTKAVFTVLGGSLGLWLGIWTLMRIAKELAAQDKGPKTGNKESDRQGREKHDGP